MTFSSIGVRGGTVRTIDGGTFAILPTPTVRIVPVERKAKQWTANDLGLGDLFYWGDDHHLVLTRGMQSMTGGVLSFECLYLQSHDRRNILISQPVTPLFRRLNADGTITKLPKPTDTVTFGELEVGELFEFFLRGGVCQKVNNTKYVGLQKGDAREPSGGQAAFVRPLNQKIVVE